MVIQLREEVEKVCQGNAPTYDTQAKLTFIDHVINEALRLTTVYFLFLSLVINKLI